MRAICIVEPCDIGLGKEYDLTLWSVKSKLIAEATAGRFDCAHAGPP